MRLRLALVFATLVVGAGPGWGEVPRCMAMAHVRTVDRSGSTTIRDSESVGPVQRIEGDGKGSWLCSEGHTCWPSADFDLVTPCSAVAMHGGTLTLR